MPGQDAADGPVGPVGPVGRGEPSGPPGPGERLTIRVTLDASAGCRNLTQRVLRFGPGRSRPRRPACEEVWFVVAGRGGLWLDGACKPLEPDAGVLLPPGTTWAVDNPGDVIVIVSVQVPGERQARGAEPAVVRLADRPAIPTGDREFRIVVDPEVGCRGVTQFVGWIPPGRAPAHRHTYEEVVYVLEGEGLLHLDGSARPIRAGSCIHLPPPVEHCLENTGTTPMRVLGVFHPAGSPASRSEASRSERT